MKYFKKIEGEHIYLSPVNSQDVATYTKWLNDFQVTDYTGRSAQIMTIEKEKQWLENTAQEEVMFAMIEKENDKLIGTCGIEEINHIHRRGTLGIMIGEKDVRGKGYGTEAMALLLEFGFRYLNLKSIFLEVFDFNQRAIACYKKCGFQEIGKRRKAMYVNGKYHDIVLMDILADEFTMKAIKNNHLT